MCGKRGELVPSRRAFKTKVRDWLNKVVAGRGSRLEMRDRLSMVPPVMQLSAIVEALLIASQEPLASEEIARLVRARVAEADDIRQRDADEGKEAAALPEWLTDLAATSADSLAGMESATMPAPA